MSRLKATPSYAQANPLQKGLRLAAASRYGSWLIAPVLPLLDRSVHRLTRGRHTFSRPVAGLHVLMLTTTGARTGVARTVPVLGLTTSAGLVVVASNFGRVNHPAWFHNICSDPEVTVSVDARSRRVRAVELTGERRAAVWRECLEVYPGYAGYQRRALPREIAVFALEPRD
jgi:deazaflavin-dependent oxidoreductase (nitroreductase family)